MKKKNSTQETLAAIRRNSAYGQSRTLSLIYCVLLVGVIGLLVFAGTHGQPFANRMAWLFGGVLAGVAASACLYHFLFAHYDQADALLQVAKFQQRSIRSRSDALALVEKIREEVNEQDEEKELEDEGLSADQKDENSVEPESDPVENQGEKGEEKPLGD